MDLIPAISKFLVYIIILLVLVIFISFLVFRLSKKKESEDYKSIEEKRQYVKNYIRIHTGYSTTTKINKSPQKLTRQTYEAPITSANNKKMTNPILTGRKIKTETNADLKARGKSRYTIINNHYTSKENSNLAYNLTKAELFSKKDRTYYS